MDEQKECFDYTFSGQQQEEIRRIRDKYLVPQEDKMERLRAMDAAVTQKANMVAIAVGVIGTLLLGTGMSCAMVWQGIWFIPGIVIGVLGMAVIAAAYPIYHKILKAQREKIAPEVLRLTEELLQ